MLWTGLAPPVAVQRLRAGARQVALIRLMGISVTAVASAAWYAVICSVRAASRRRWSAFAHALSFISSFMRACAASAVFGDFAGPSTKVSSLLLSKHTESS